MIREPLTMPPASGRVSRSGPRSGGLGVEAITDMDAFMALEPAWNALLEESPVDHPFLTHEWVRTWWECFGSGSRLHIVVVKQDGRPLAIAPLMISRSWTYGVRVRTLRSIHNVYAMRSDLIVSARHPEAYAALWRHLIENSSGWDVLQLCQLPVDTPTLERMSWLAAEDGYLTGLWHSSESPYLPIRDGWDAYQRGLDAKHRSNIRNRMRRLGRLGPMEMRVVTRNDDDLDRNLDTGFRLEAAAWKGRNGTAIDSDPQVRRFFALLARRSAKRGWLRLHFLVGDGREIAFDYSLMFRDKLYLLKSGYDPGYGAYSPYNLLCYLVLQRAFADRVVEFDFLGANEPWKLEWTRCTRAHRWLYVFPNAPWARAVRFAKFRAIPWTKALIPVASRVQEVGKS